jgi:hypothetical protein
VTFIAEQLGADAIEVGEYASRDQTRRIALGRE